MNIEWIGHACVCITTADGTKLVMDPFNPGTGYILPELTADLATVSHEHWDHNAVINAKTIKTVEPYESGSIEIKGFMLDHDDKGGALRGKNIAYRVKADGLTVLHMGDVGCIPEDSFFDEIGHIDVLIIPVGGVYTVDGAQAVEVCKRISPNLILPIHYRTQFSKMTVLSHINVFTDAAKEYFDCSHQAASSVNITKDTLKKRTRIILLTPSAKPE